MKTGTTRLICLILSLVMLVGMLPTAYATEETETTQSMETTAVAETTAPTEGTTTPAEETTAPTEETVAPTEETTAPTEETTAPTEETTAPTEETVAPTEETTAPTEETTAPTEATTAPTEETTASSIGEDLGQTSEISIYSEHEHILFCGHNVCTKCGGKHSTYDYVIHRLKRRVENGDFVDDRSCRTCGKTYDWTNTPGGKPGMWAGVLVIGHASGVGTDDYEGWFGYTPYNVENNGDNTDNGDDDESQCIPVEPVALSPVNGADDVGYIHDEFPEFQIVFDRKISGAATYAGTFADLNFEAGTIKIFRKDGDELVHIVKKDSDLNISYNIDGSYDEESKILNGSTFSLDISDTLRELQQDTEYYITVDEGVIRFEDGNINAAIEKGDWTFKTKAGDTCRLADLRTEDYLALADLCYVQPNEDLRGKTVREIIGEENWGTSNTSWSKFWSSSGISNSERYANIENWIVIGYQANEQAGGFCAFTFANNYGEAVIAYRGTNDLADIGEDIYQGIGGEGVQPNEAFQYAKMVIDKFGSNCVHITGHSLGGALCDIVSARFGCKGVSFNAAPFLKNAYYYYPEEMGMEFTGVGGWQFTDHITEDDQIAGMMSLDVKNYIIHSCNDMFSTLIERHMPPSLLVKNESGIGMTLALETQKITWPVETKVGVSNLYLGTRSSDQFCNALAVFSAASYGANGNDYIMTGINKDTIIGGRGDDILSGGWNDDVYYYFKGDGTDTIYDISGHDTIKLLGFSESDQLEVESKGNYVFLSINGETVVKVAKNRALGNHSMDVVVQKGNIYTTTNITAEFNPKTVQMSMTIACPVNVEVIDDVTGKVVGTLLNEADSEGVQCTSYGYSYVYPDESENYVKSVDLFEGYSVRICGTDIGNMDISVFKKNSDGIGRIVSAEDIPVVQGMVASVEVQGNQIALAVDSDGDGVIDNFVPLDEDDKEEEGNTPLQPMYRLYNPYTLEHLFTTGEWEKDNLPTIGWIYEGVAWYAPTTGTPIYRLYNPYSDGHFYTASEAEVDSLLPLGWQMDGVVTYGADSSGTPIYRLFNPYETKNYHHYTTSWDEINMLTGLGWILEGVAWYAA